MAQNEYPMLTDDQKVMLEVLEEYAQKEQMSVVMFLARRRKFDETVGDCIERVYAWMGNQEARNSK